MTTIQDIMQVGVGVPDRERLENFARDLLGFSTSRSPDGRVSYLRPDQYLHRIAAYTAPEPVLQYIGFDVGGGQQLAEWETELTAEGIDWRRSGPKSLPNGASPISLNSTIPTDTLLLCRMASGRQRSGALYS